VTTPVPIAFVETETDTLAGVTGQIALFADPAGRLDRAGQRVNRLTRGAVQRLIDSARFAALAEGEAAAIGWPAGMAAETVQVVRLGRRADVATARKAGAGLGRILAEGGMTVLAGAHPRAAEIAHGLALRAYRFDDHRTGEKKPFGPVRVMAARPDAVAARAGDMAALTEAVFFARDLVNEPANVLTTDDFAARLAAMQEIGLEVEILEEAELARLGMRALLGVGQGSDSPSKVVVMQWCGGGEAAPLALIGKGVVFDTGGVSIKPAEGMEAMTSDMAGAAVVAGVMRGLALRRSRANVVGLVGLVENMPDGRAQRPGDIVRSMKGDTIEVINTDAEGRLVLADVMWYAQQRFRPAALIDLATLTGAIVVGLGHENAGAFANNDALAGAFLGAAAAEGEGAWRMPLGKAYDELLKSDKADMKNVGGRAAGSITAAQFLQRFVADGTPWLHLDIAGVASVPKDTDVAPKGATGWGVRALDRMIRDGFEV
jgi:leucyl aminopeptidase